MAEATIAGRYQLSRKIGEGGMGEVWEAEDVSLRRRIAVKMMSPDLVESSAARARFEREAMAIAQLRNQHVVHVYDYGINAGSPYIVMELLEGEDLQRRLDRVGRFSLGAAVAAIVQVSRGLAAAHAAGIVHRDLKPANVLLTRVDAEDIAKILDFGVIAHLTGSDQNALTSPGALVGTPAYMSPEQIRASTVDHRSDLWSLAVMAYVLLTGRLPFTGRWLGDLIIDISTRAFPPPSTLVPELSPAVDHFFERALAKDPTQRFQSARELASAFASLADGDGRRPAKILVADDEPDMAVLMKQCFRAHLRDGTCEFIFAADGEEALQALNAHPDIDVVLTDINMPRMDGLTLLARVSETRPQARVVVVTAYGDMHNIRTAMNRGAFDFLIKPLNPSDLLLTVEKTLKQVSEARKSARSGHENSLLKTFASPLLVERLDMPDRTISTLVEPGTVAFIDLAGFQERTRGKSPGEVVQLLNANFDVIVPEITLRGGVVGRFLGDAVMILFRGRDHLTNALDTCLAVRAQLETLNRRAGKNSPFARALSMGVATGDIVLAEVGSRSSHQLDYTALGPVVSTAAQLEVMAQPNQILLSGDACVEAASHFTLSDRGHRLLAGTHKPARIFEVIQRIPSSPAGTMANLDTTAEEELQTTKSAG
ncbi:protein kinase domain-containing protein [Chondromyces apiculatus]|uniref:Uncharacterized protein n=1 Tax=Chondromyces apiculatus DSM 436 TaxID=1192034 RepID=A0A017T925_9BACT|nr:protein kinase [Chondromyces apiculatus]EYF05773.1 Hypothetical protein CAP_3063 [Chondromyces apiculatus DSM 436]